MTDRATKNGPWILAATILGSSMAFVDGTVVNVALPALQRGLGATVSDLQWIIEAYALFFSALLLVGGAAGDHFGRRRVYAVGIALFAGASAVCGLAPTAGALIAARAVQGVGAALLVPGSLALIAASFDEHERGRAIGTWSGLSAMTAAFGPVLGGFLIDHVSWRWAFFINVPIAAATLLLLFRHVPESRDESARGPLDLAGAALATLALGGVVYALIESSRLGWTAPAVRVALVGGGLAFLLFFLVEARVKAPMLPLGLFRSRAFAGANLLTFWLYGALAMLFFALPLNLIQVQGWSATAAGAALLPFIGIMVVLSRWSGGLLDRLGARLPLVVGPLLSAAGFALFARPGVGGSYWATFFPPTVVLGLGMAMTVAPLTTTVMNAVETAHAGVASGVNNAVSRAAGLLAIALMTIPMVHVFESHLAQGMAGAALRPAVVTATLAQAARLADAQAPALATPAERAAVKGIVAQSFVAGFRWVAWAAAALALASALTALVTFGPRRDAPGAPAAGPAPPG
jgi:EmrB/QacA subfamily drug resistance transporter